MEFKALCRPGRLGGTVVNLTFLMGRIDVTAARQVIDSDTHVRELGAVCPRCQAIVPRLRIDVSIIVAATLARTLGKLQNPPSGDVRSENECDNYFLADAKQLPHLARPLFNRVSA
jgi:hypothetical protein